MGPPVGPIIKKIGNISIEIRITFTKIGKKTGEIGIEEVMVDWKPETLFGEMCVQVYETRNN